MNEKDLSWFKLIDAGREIAMNNIRGFLPSRIAQFLINLHTSRTPFYLSRHGQSVYNGQARCNCRYSHLTRAPVSPLARPLATHLAD